MRGDHAGWTILNLRVDVENVNLAFRSPFLLVEMGHHLLDLGKGLFQLLAVRVGGEGSLGVLQQVSQQKGNGGQPLHWPYHQLRKSLS